ncbi:MAG: hypothetical protein ACSLE9_13030 [Burkholderiaceae bacterium]
MKLDVVGSGEMALALLGGCTSLPGGAAKDADEHAAHHPPPAAGRVDAPKFDQQMKALQEMHQKRQSARTPEERAALMLEHMKTMRDGMAMMGQMRGGGMGMGMGAGKGPMGGGMPLDHETMQQRMDMMEAMMQMMLDREPVKPPAAK